MDRSLPSLGQIRVCLSMIVRNEGATLGRCLAAARPLADAAVICDTGSADDTVEIARRFFERHDLPARICHHPWTGFGPNRTAAIEEATRFVQDLGWPLDRTYWLFLDADLELIVDPAFDRAALDTDGIRLPQRSRHGLLYWTLRLARASRGWSVVGRTHERYQSSEPASYAHLSTLSIRDHGDGGSKTDKLPRDIAWLTEQLSKTPDDPRTLFYLARTYRASGDALKALLLFRRRVAVGPDDEEAWYSRLCIGQILFDTGHLDAAESALREAAAAAPSRAEPLYELSRLSLRRNDRAGAIAYADRGRQIPVPATSTTFVHADVYEHRLDLQLADAALGTAESARGLAACERVARRRAAPADALDAAQQLAVRYAAPLAGAEFLPIKPALPPPYRPCNPSLIRARDGYLAICRAVNYDQRRLWYRSLEDDGSYRTRNVLMRLNGAFEVLGESEIVLDEPPPRVTRIQGLEDCRLILTETGLAFTCATADRHPSGRVHQSICRLDEKGSVSSHRPLCGPFDDRVQKNWLPFVSKDGGLHAIYSYDPLVALRLHPETGDYHVGRSCTPPINAARWRGSAGPIAWGDGGERQLVLVHESVRRDGPDGRAERVYLHRFVEYDGHWALTRLSRPFVFAHKGVEFSCGMATSHDGASLVIGLGLEDREAYLARVSCTRVEALLEPVEVS